MNFLRNKITNSKNFNQHGFTLIEVLLSIILLSIILTSFMGFFTQSALFTKKNGQKLDTMQTAQYIIKSIDKNVTIQKLKENGILKANEEINSSDGLTYTISGSQQIYSKLGIELDSTIDGSYSIDVIFSRKEFPYDATNINNTIKLIQVEVIVKALTNEQGNQSNTYTFIRK